MIQLGSTIRTLREDRGLKQSELAEKADVSVSFLCHIENDKREPSPALARKLAKALSVPIEVLVWGALNTPPNLSEEEREVFRVAKSLASNYLHRTDGNGNTKI